jgi:hypothetical protein
MEHGTMTKATDKPVRRLVQTKHWGTLVVEIRERTFTIRPPRARRDGPAAVELAYGQLYQRGLLAKGRR